MNNNNPKLKSKRELIDKFNEVTKSNVYDNDVKYVVIRFDTLGWCKFEPLECIFAEEDTFEEFNKELIKILKDKYPVEAETITDIEYSFCPVVGKNPAIRYSGRVWDSVKDNDVLYLAWIQRTEWHAGYKAVNPE
jgi:hypothetical protein